MGDILLEIDLGNSFIPMQIVVGYDHTCALSTAYKVKCWGYNLRGALGYGDTNNRGDALSTAYKVKCWGYNLRGALGYGDTNHRGDEANEMGDDLLEIDLGTSFVPMQIAPGYDHTCALSTAYKVKCFGENSDGQLGYGDTNNRGGEANQMGDTLLEIDLG
eukprot:793204_1